MTKQKIPKIRFNNYTDAWEQQKLGEVAKIVMGQSPSSENYTENPNDHILVQGNADIKNNRVVPRVWTTQITKQAQKGDLIISVRAPVGDVGKTDYDVVIGRGVAAIKGNEFVFHILGKMKQSGYWNALSTGSTFESINSTDLNNASVILPTSTEQTVIGDFFRQLDTLLTLHQRKLEELKSFKSTMLSKMFPKHGQTVPEIRLTGFDGEWKTDKLKNRMNISAGGDIDKSRIKTIDKYPVVANALTNKGIVGYYDDYKVKAPAVTVTGRGDVGHAIARHTSFTPIVRLLSLQSNDFDVDFLENMINSIRIYNESTGVPQLTAPQLGNYYIQFPSLDEQRVLGTFFSNLDNLTSSIQSKIEELKTLKKKLLQDMFV
ncbi:restriction endonuclease subunit S [Streptococcus downei]|uniref:Type I restriction-modification system, specificity subunit S n=1 Tax=Streptococcus downei MFe28 TaxID=764290 RepID=A0A380JEP3_STRDO|nr:restriction endonuclease subunit S [Streptococcus downei]SUN36580.1 type I restriction-modification system, specificity subunit S [Streptococcus downei MFe28]